MKDVASEDVENSVLPALVVDVSEEVVSVGDCVLMDVVVEDEKSEEVVSVGDCVVVDGNSVEIGSVIVINVGVV